MRALIISALGVVAIVCVSVRPTTANEQSSVGQRITPFSLPDYYGKNRSLDEFADAKVVVVAFLGTDCPLVKLYAPRLQELADSYAERGVAVIGINSNLQDPITKIAAQARSQGIKFPVLKDVGNVVADMFRAERTPEVFVLDAERVIRYRGPIDDQYGLGAGSGYARPEIQNRYVTTAVDELLGGQAVSNPLVRPTGCLIGRVSRVAPHGEVTYSKHIAPIFQNRCVECHRPGQIGPFALTSYDEVLGWAPMIREVVNDGRMPPWFADPEYGHFSNDARMTDEEKALLYQWVECGCPEGDRADLPAAREFVEGWQIPQPDAVFAMSDKPYKVQAEGTIDYQYFTVDPQFTEDKWICAAEARPGNRAVVHHIIVFIAPPGQEGSERAGGATIGFAPGMGARKFADGMAMKIPAGSKMRFQMHYTSVGSEQEDLSSVGFCFVDAKSVKQEIKGSICGNVSFRIPPGDGNFEVHSKRRFRRDTLLLSMLPHMHLRGKSFRYELEYADGSREILLDVPRYDFNWQLWYNLQEPKLIPKGTRLHCTARFDNSSDNPFNPDPTQEVRFGEQTWEEMMFGFMTVTDPHQDLTRGIAGDELPATAEDKSDEVPDEKVAL